MSLWTVALLGCGEAEGDLTWSTGGRDLVEANCSSCHASAENAPFELTTLAEVQQFAAPAAAALRSGEMPPWGPDPGCAHYQHERLMTAADRDALLAFLDAGAPQGEGDDAPAAITSIGTLDGITDVGTVPDYVPDFGASDDDYRCFLLSDLSFPELGFVTAAEVRPDAASVHHVLVYALTDAQADSAREADGADGRPGYTCLGSPLPTTGDQELIPSLADVLSGDIDRSFTEFPNQLAGWVPGNSPQELPEGQAIRVAPGSLVVAQLHYSAVGGNDAVPDRTEVRLRTTSSPPTTLVKTSAVITYDLDIPAGIAASTFTYDTPYYGTTPVSIRSVAGHMHLLGTSLRGEVLGEAEDKCLLDIPDWDFHWQGTYNLLAPIEVNSGETVRLTCTYDATDAEENVLWGEGSEDEMCLLFFSRTEPYLGEPEPGVAACAEQSDCATACEGDYDCIVECAAPDPGCRTCLQSAVTTCAPGCATSLLGDLECAERCVLSGVLLGGSTHQCLAAECPDTASTIDRCYSVATSTPACTDALDACGL
jgi:hypothetical protein